MIALYTFISIYKSSLLHFIDSDYVNGEYVPKGGDGLTDGLFLQLFHYLNLAVFYVLNIVFIVRSFIKKNYKGIIIAIVSMLLMLSIYAWKKSVTNNSFKIEVNQNLN